MKYKTQNVYWQVVEKLSMIAILRSGATKNPFPERDPSPAAQDGRGFFSSLLGLCGILVFAFALAACGEKQEGNFGGGSSTPPAPATVDMSALGVDTKTISHSDFTASATHSAKLCADCHTGVAREKVCSQAGCHPFSKYAAAMTNWDHAANNTGDQCDKCHYSVEKNIASENPKVAGWRQTLRVSSTQWHAALKGVCLNCHDVNNISNFPSSHQTDANRQKNCENCHHYKVNSAGTGGAWGGGHTAAVSGCNASGCHAKHYSGYDCAWCHSGAVSNGYTSWTGTWHHRGESSSGCSACHGAGGFGN